MKENLAQLSRDQQGTSEMAPGIATESSRSANGTPLENVNVIEAQPLLTPLELKSRLPASDSTVSFVDASRRAIEAILDKRDSRLLVIVGPCSIHDIDSAREYAKRLVQLAFDTRDELFIVMRVYFEKPRTTVGWKGLINDPNLDGSFDLATGIELARELLLELANMGLPTATEALDTTVPQYIGDLVSWTAIGARTTESQSHRELASGLSTPVGFKNGTEGQIEVATNAMQSAGESHHFMGISDSGLMSVFRTRGNEYGHIVLRGGKEPNYDRHSVEQCDQTLKQAGMRRAIVVDCSHGNSRKDPYRQPGVALDCVNQVVTGQVSLIGLMVESHLQGGNQSLENPQSLTYGQSITDGCIDWEATESLLIECADRLRSRRR